MSDVAVPLKRPRRRIRWGLILSYVTAIVVAFTMLAPFAWMVSASLKLDRDVFAFEGFVGADRQHRLPVRVIAEKAWHALFAQTLFLRPDPVDLEDFLPGFTVIDCGALHADPDADGTRSSVFVSGA